MLLLVFIQDDELAAFRGLSEARRELLVFAREQHAVNTLAMAVLLDVIIVSQAVALDGTKDPCAGPTPTATAAQCVLTGVSAAQYGHIGANSASQYFGLLGGNPNLKPEKSDTYSAGIVLTPHFVPNFSMTFDYFNIKLQDTIGKIGADIARRILSRL